MNFKFNYWTLLFIAALVGAGYLQMQVSKLQEARPEPAAQAATTTCPILTIDKSQIDKFKNHRLSFQLPDTSTIRLANPEVRGWKIPHCELSEMLQTKDPNSHAEVFLALKSNNGNPAMDSIVVNFVVQDKLDANKFLVYDFTTPCPPCRFDNQ